LGRENFSKFAAHVLFAGLAHRLLSVVSKSNPTGFRFAMIQNDHKTRKTMSNAERDVATDDNRTQHVRLVFAMHRLEACLGQAAPGRESDWQDEVSNALDLLLAAMRESRECVQRDDGLIEEVMLEKPFLVKRIKNLRAEFDGLFNQASALQDQIKDARETQQKCHTQQIGFADLRQRMSWLLTALRHHQAKESDLVFEAFNIDIGVGD
jgi:uncharacterized coiled-coil DUF342 family protein